MTTTPLSGIITLPDGTKSDVMREATIAQKRENLKLAAAAIAAQSTESPMQSDAVLVTPDPDTRLAQLVTQYDLAKAEADKAVEALKAINDAIKVELITAAPGRDDIRLESPELTRPLRLFAVSSWRLDAKTLKAEAPEVYVKFAKQSTAWQLRPVS